MAYLIPSLLVHLEIFRPCCRVEAFHHFRRAVCAWLLCLGRRTLSEVFQGGELPADKHHDALYHLFANAAWEPRRRTPGPATDPPFRTHRTLVVGR